LKVIPGFRSLRLARSSDFSRKNGVVQREICRRLVSTARTFSAERKLKIEPPANKKALMTMFKDCEGLLLCEFLPPKTTISSNKYNKTLET
jgi:hypothetical protein